MRSLSPREFLRNSTKASAGAATVLSGLSGPSSASAVRPKKAAPNDKVHIALIGCGGMGTGDLADFLRLPEVECLALCDVDQHRLDETVQTVQKLRGRAPDGYRDFRKVLDRQDVHAVAVAMMKSASRSEGTFSARTTRSPKSLAAISYPSRTI